MTTNHLITRLLEHHKEIECCLRDGQALLGDGDASQLKALGLARWRLMRALRTYQLFKHTEIFDPIIAGVCPLRGRMAGELKHRCMELGNVYETHVKRWALSGPAHSWPHYTTETTTLIRHIRAHLTTEAAAIQTLIAGLQRSYHVNTS